MADGVVGVVAVLVVGLVHADEFEEEVGEGGEVEELRVDRSEGCREFCRDGGTYDGNDHAWFVFSAGE